MFPISQQTYLAMRQGAKVLEADRYGDKVLRLTDGTFLKLFRRKRLISSALLWPYAKRFANNACKLEQLGIACPKILNLYRLAEPLRDIVHYTPLPGLTLRQLRDEPAQCPKALFADFGVFMAMLHDKGIYFRSVHLGNVVLTPELKLGLIDIADLKTQAKPLSRALRLRNFQHMLRDSKDRAWLASAKYGDFAQSYCSTYTHISAATINNLLHA